jgi:FKBP-type peptidyl-prolyl cis-trans isomerase
MKFTTPLVAGLLSAGLLVAAMAQPASQPAAPAQDQVKFNIPNVAAPAGNAPAAAAPAAPAPKAPAPAQKFTEAQLMETFGYSFALQSGLVTRVQALEFTPAQIEALANGISEALAGKQLAYDPQQIVPQVEELFKGKEQAFLTKLRNRNLADTATYLAKLKENKAVQELSSGLRFEVVKAATGASPKAGQLAKVHYTLSFTNGQVIESSVQRGEPAELLVQVPSKEDPRGIIPGMAEGLQKMNVGGKYKLHVPPHLAYGDDGAQGIPPGATLVFEVELLDVKDAPKEAAPAGK